MVHDSLSVFTPLLQIILGAVFRPQFFLDCLPPQADFHPKCPVIRQSGDPLGHEELGCFVISKKALLLTGSLVGVPIRLLYVFGLAGVFVKLNPPVMLVQIPLF